MASCKTTQWAEYAPYVKLTVTESDSTTTTATLSWRLEYIASSPAETSQEKDYTVSIAGTKVKSGTYDIDGKTGTHTIASGTKVITKGSAAKTISFEVSFAFKLTWSGSYKGSLTASGSISVAASSSTAPTYTACGAPSSLSIINNGNNTATISCKIGSNGTNNDAEGVDLFVTCDGTTPSTSNYNYKYSISGAASATVSKTISFTELSSQTMSEFLGTDYVGTLKFTARTVGEAATKYYSSTATEKSTTFTWYSTTKAPEILTPIKQGESTGLLSAYKVSWSAGAAGINNAISKYTLRVYNVTTAKTVATYSTTNTYYNVAASVFAAGNTYRFYLTTVGKVSGFDGPESQSGLLTVKTINKFTNLTLTASDGNTICSTDVLGYKTYIDIGSGTVLKLSWNTPTATGNNISSYDLNISRYDPVNSAFTTIYSSNIGKVNEFYINSALLTAVPQTQYQLSIYVTARSSFGTAYDGTSNIITLYVNEGCGTYIKATESYKQPIMKRAVAFAQIPVDTSKAVLTGRAGSILVDANNKPLLTVTKSTIGSDDWNIMQKFYSKDTSGAWKTSDIRYEVLVDENGEIITDINNEPIYTL